MPEGDTVWRTARLLDRALAGHVLTRCDFRVPELALVDLTGGVVRQTVSRGKHLLTHVDLGPSDPSTSHPVQCTPHPVPCTPHPVQWTPHPVQWTPHPVQWTPHPVQWTLHTHLKMEGVWQVYSPGQRWRRPQHQARVILQTDRQVAVGFSLGILELIPRAEEDAVVGHLGPDLLGPDWDEAEALRRLSADPARAIREALLDQRVVAGIGNMYVAELCFLHGTHPQTPVGDVSNPMRLIRRAQQVLELNKDRAIQCTTGDLRNGMRMWVYRREKQPCRRCDAPIQIAMLGETGRERAAYWCLRCQPAPP
jgi:endonuclease VIII